MQDRDLIKAEIVQLLISVPEKIQLQISDALAIMADEDFPEKWDNLLEVKKSVFFIAIIYLKGFANIKRYDFYILYIAIN